LYTPLCTGDFDFVPGTPHQVAAPTPQQDGQGNYWVFNSFGNGLAQNSTYVADNNLTAPDTVFANFDPGVQMSVFSIPSGLPILIDGNALLTPNPVVWAQGTTHQVSAPATLVDAQGHTYTFVRWSNGGSATQSVTAPSSSTLTLLWAVYQAAAQVQVTSNPQGITINVNGNACTTPCIVNQAAGTQVPVVVPSSIAGDPGTRLDFDSWSGGGASTTLQVTITQAFQVLVANYHTSYQLAMGANPAAAATLAVNPLSRDGYYPSGTPITVTATPKSGYKFLQWQGDYTGNTTTAYLSMAAPRAVTAMLTAVNATPTITTMNAAGPTPDGSIAVGSLISIFGESIGDTTAVATTNPLKQSLEGVSVTANNLLFPLLFVSSQQINAQVPWELAPGKYTLTVHWAGHPDVSGPITVAAEAPGMYELQNDQNLPLAVAVHQDWTLITPTSPARRGEYVTIYVNGLGPLDHNSLDGFSASLTTLFAATDKITVNINGTLTLTPYWAGASPGTIGTDVVILQIVDSIPAAATLNLTVTANGKTSTVVQLPVQ
jgi:uncharacterized protein (TIGR03437 family)